MNVVAILRGTEDGNRFAIMSGDIDTWVSDPMNAESDSPGANDNGSGMAGVIEAARVLSQYRFPGSIAFVGLSGEEQGLNGGAILAQHAIDAGWNIDAVVNNDMIGNITGVNGVTNNTTARVFSEGHGTSKQSRKPGKDDFRAVKSTRRRGISPDMSTKWRTDTFRTSTS